MRITALILPKPPMPPPGNIIEEEPKQNRISHRQGGIFGWSQSGRLAREKLCSFGYQQAT